MAVFIAQPAAAEVYVGSKIPATAVVASSGKILDLGGMGKITVLEWSSPVCPYSKRYYEKGIMQSLQKTVRERGGEWITVYSDAPGQPGFMDAKQEALLVKARQAGPSYSVLDKEGALGRMFSAKTTPFIAIIGQDGKIAYTGTVDNSMSYRMDKEGSRNYVLEALDDMAAERPLRNALTRPYGCIIKYSKASIDQSARVEAAQNH